MDVRKILTKSKILKNSLTLIEHFVITDDFYKPALIPSVH